jgi:hypothetical protein
MSESRPLGRRRWVFAGGHVPVGSTGSEPEFTSREELDLLNDDEDAANVELRFLFEESDPAGPFRLRVEAHRVRHVRVNDLIDPHAIPLGVPFGLVVTSDVPVVAQLTRTDTRRGQLAVSVAPGFADDE